MNDLCIIEVRKWALDTAARWATERTIRTGDVPSPEDVERWAIRAVHFVFYGTFQDVVAEEPKVVSE